jgi:hypothetical protein
MISQHNENLITKEFGAQFYKRLVEAEKCLAEDPHAACVKLRELLVELLKAVGKRVKVELYNPSLRKLLENDKIKKELTPKEEKLVEQIRERRNRSSYAFEEDQVDAKRSFEDMTRMFQWYFERYKNLRLQEISSYNLPSDEKGLELWIKQVSFVDAGYAYQKSQERLSKPIESDVIDFNLIRRRKALDKPPAEHDTLVFEYFFLNKTGKRVDEFSLKFSADKDIIVHSSSFGGEEHVGYSSKFSQSFKPSSNNLRRINLLNGATSSAYKLCIKLERGTYDGINEKVMKPLPVVRFDILLPDLPPSTGPIDFNVIKDLEFPLKVS